jgi:hypothetical protein
MTLNLYLGDAVFEFWSKHQLSWLRVFSSSPQSLQADVGIVPQLRPACFISNSFQFVLYFSFYFNPLSEIWKLLHNNKRMLIYSYSSLNSGYENERVCPHVVFLLFTVITLFCDCFMHFIVIIVWQLGK